MGKLIVIRHGETDYNVQKRYAGRTDVKLNGNGVCQAKAAAESLKQYPVDIIMSSPLKQALQTAEVISSCIGKPILVMEQFAKRRSCAALSGIVGPKYQQATGQGTGWRRNGPSGKGKGFFRYGLFMPELLESECASGSACLRCQRGT